MKKLKLYLRAIFNKLKLFYYYFNDFNRFSKNAIGMNITNSYTNMQGLLVLYYHSIEKGLSHQKIKFGFGKNIINEFIDILLLYEKSNYSKEDFNYKVSISVLNKYIQFHLDNGFDIYNKYEKLRLIKFNGNLDLGGTKIIEKDHFKNIDMLGFEEFSKKRVSIRDYSSETIDLTKINDALSIAMSTPSVCNRQMWQVYVITAKDKIEDILILHGGMRGHAENIGALIILTIKIGLLSHPEERNQGFIDGGLYLMNIIYALTNVGYATCILNAALKLSIEQKIRKIIGIEEDRILISFISIGNLNSTNLLTKSERLNYKDYTIFVK